jgi:hypothetical protein
VDPALVEGTRAADQQAALLRVATLVAAQSIANERARAELRASRARIVRTADETRRPPS